MVGKVTLQTRVRATMRVRGMITGDFINGGGGRDDGGRAYAGCDVVEGEDQATCNGETRGAAGDEDESMGSAEAEGGVDGKDDAKGEHDGEKESGGGVSGGCEWG